MTHIEELATDLREEQDALDDVVTSLTATVAARK